MLMKVLYFLDIVPNVIYIVYQGGLRIVVCMCMYMYVCMKSWKCNLKHLQFKMGEIALKGKCDLVSIMVPPSVSLKEWFSQKKRKQYIHCMSQKVRECCKS